MARRWDDPIGTVGTWGALVISQLGEVGAPIVGEVGRTLETRGERHRPAHRALLATAHRAQCVRYSSAGCGDVCTPLARSCLFSEVLRCQHGRVA